MFVSFLAALVGAALIELILRLTQHSPSSLRRSIFKSYINIISIAVGVAIGNQLAIHLESKWQGAAAVGLSVGMFVAIGQFVVHYHKKAQQNTPTDRA